MGWPWAHSLLVVPPPLQSLYVQFSRSLFMCQRRRLATSHDVDADALNGVARSKAWLIVTVH
jgi:hypothetical protein